MAGIPFLAWKSAGLYSPAGVLNLLHLLALLGLFATHDGESRMSIGTRLFTWLHGELVGSDEFGNKYYVHRRTKGQKREKRWVLYNGEAEASRVPPEWHAWLHATTAVAPTTRAKTKSWQKPHEPNRTGTDLAYRPPGHTLMGGHRAKATGDYEPWSPV